MTNNSVCEQTPPTRASALLDKLIELSGAIDRSRDVNRYARNETAVAQFVDLREEILALMGPVRAGSAEIAVAFQSVWAAADVAIKSVGSEGMARYWFEEGRQSVPVPSADGSPTVAPEKVKGNTSVALLRRIAGRMLEMGQAANATAPNAHGSDWHFVAGTKFRTSDLRALSNGYSDLQSEIKRRTT